MSATTMQGAPYRTVHKFYWDFEREESWLNEMAAQGLALVRYRWGTYTFERTKPGEWLYRIELLEQSPDKPKSREYLDFMRETGAEPVATYMRWVYFRRPAEEGPFDLFSDLDSRIAHYERVTALFGSLLAAFIPLTTVQLINVSRMDESTWFFGTVFLVYVMIVLVFGYQTYRAARQARALKRRKQLFE